MAGPQGRGAPAHDGVRPIRRLRPASGPWSVDEIRRRQVGDPGLTELAIAELGPGPVAWAIETTERADDRLGRGRGTGRQEISAGRGRQAREVALISALLTLARGGQVEERFPGQDVLEEIARSNARQGVPLDVLSNRIWAGHSVTKDLLLSSLRAVTPPTDSMDLVLDRAGAGMFDFAQAFIERITVVYDEEYRRIRSREQIELFQLLDSVAAGASPPKESSRILPGAWFGGHLCAVIWQHESRYAAALDEEVARFATDAAAALGATSHLLVSGGGAFSAWWQFAAAPPGDVLQRLGEVRRPDWLLLALGPTTTGLEGFRESFQGAVAAARVGQFHPDDGTWLYDDVAYLSLMLENRAAAGLFVTRELRGLLGDDPWLAEIRETLRVYLVEHNSRAAAAQRLHIAPGTVAYRVNRAGELLGRSVRDRQHAILLALQLHRVLDPLGR